MTKIIVFTDIHIDVDPRPGCPDAEARLAAGVAHVMQHHADADMVIATGDLTHKGDVASYRRLRGLLEPLTLPTHLLLGNHDNRENFLSVFPESETDANGFVQRVVDVPDARLVMLDTLFAPPYDYPASHAGALCDARLAWLEAALTQSDKPCLIFMHHPPYRVGMAAMDSIRLRDEDAFFAVIERAGNARHLISGHVHRTISGTHRGLSYSMFKSFVGQSPMDFDTMDFHTEVDEPAAYGIVFPTREGVTVHSDDFELSATAKSYA